MGGKNDELVGLDPFDRLDQESGNQRPDENPGAVVGGLDDEAFEPIITRVLPRGQDPHTVTGLEGRGAVGRYGLFHGTDGKGAHMPGHS